MSLAVVLLTALTAAVGAFTVLIDQALLGVLSGVLGAVAGGVEAWRARSNLESTAAAYRVGYVEIDNQLDLFLNNGGIYGEISDATDTEEIAAARKRAYLTERLAAINLATERASS